MSEVKGKLVTCNRCGATTFLKFVEYQSMDGGFSPGYDKYEELPDEWLRESEFGHLCPDCADQFRAFMSSFLGNDNLVPKWRSTSPTVEG